MRETVRIPGALEATTTGWPELLAIHGEELLETSLPKWLYQQRWFGAKTRKIVKVKALNWVELPSALSTHAGSPEANDWTLAPSFPPALFSFEVAYDDGASDVYQVPLALSRADSAETIQGRHGRAVITRLAQQDGEAVLFDASVCEAVRQTLLQLIESNVTLKPFSLTSGILTAQASTAFASARGIRHLAARLGSAEQSNTSIIYGNTLILKLFRRIQPGENPDVEIGRFLTEVAHFPHIAPFLGEIALAAETGEKTTIALLQGLVTNKGDGWEWFAKQLQTYFEAVATLPAPLEIPAASFLGDTVVPPQLLPYFGEALGAAALLGQRTAEMHLALDVPTLDPAFQAEPLNTEGLNRDALRIQAQTDSAINALKTAFTTLPADVVDQAATLISRHGSLLGKARDLAMGGAAGKRIRIHGDYHLGQTLRVASANAGLATPDGEGDFVLLDFEGEPARPLSDRRRKESPLRDVAGMLRSFSYAAHSALIKFLLIQEPTADISLRSWAGIWESSACGEFLRAYRVTIAADSSLLPPPERAQTLLEAYVLEKALYELLYELNNRPTWLRIPLAGILSL